VMRIDEGVHPDRCHIIGNGVNLSLYDKRQNIGKIPGKIIWGSSPDRGLHHAIEIFKLIQEQLPHSKFYVYYAFEPAFRPSMWNMDYRSELLWQIHDALHTTPGVEYVGAVDKNTLALAQMEAELLLFPEDTVKPSETFSIAVCEAMAAGCVPLISDCDCLAELWSKAAPMLPLPIKYQEWADAAVELLTNHDLRSIYQEQCLLHAQTYSWERIGLQWSNLIQKIWNEKPCPVCGRPLGEEKKAA
jgi:glycosyltransferase involved in cell wall biosynthesis